LPLPVPQASQSASVAQLPVVVFQVQVAANAACMGIDAQAATTAMASALFAKRIFMANPDPPGAGDCADRLQASCPERQAPDSQGKVPERLRIDRGSLKEPPTKPVDRLRL
jgi:hypothetical protein